MMTIAANLLGLAGMGDLITWPSSQTFDTRPVETMSLAQRVAGHVAVSFLASSRGSGVRVCVRIGRQLAFGVAKRKATRVFGK
jgi:hypothetical protein